MQKVFRLLRHNNEQGPYTIGDLLQQHLVPDDLIWVDGESTAWAHPQEMEVLKYAVDVKFLKKDLPAAAPELPKVPQVKTTPLHVSTWTTSPAAEIERKAEELRQRTLAFKKGSANPVASWQPQTAPIIPVSENDIEFIYHKRKGLPVGEVLMGAMVVGLLAMGWYGGGKDLFQQPKAIASAVAVKMVATEENAAIGAPDTVKTDTTAIVAVTSSDTAVQKSQSLAVVTKKATPKAIPMATTAEPMEEPVAAVNKPETAPVKKADLEVVKMSTPATTTKEEVKTEAPATVAKTEEASPAENVEKKKGLGKVLQGLFKKKKKEDNKSMDEEQASTN